MGPGYLEEEFRALGVPRKRRGRDTDDMIDFLHACGESELIEAHGQPLVLSPKLDCPPIYVGGGPEIAIPRTVRCADGWMPVGFLPDELAPHVAELNQRGADAGRGPLEVVAMKTLPLDDRAAAIDLAAGYRFPTTAEERDPGLTEEGEERARALAALLADAGVTHLVHTQGYDSPAQYAEIVQQIDGEIRAAL